MEKINLGYSTKNIMIPRHQDYLKRLIYSTEQLIRRMRWKAYFFLNPSKRGNIEKSYGFKSHRSPPPIPELQPFEDKMLHLIQSVKFRKTHRDRFQRTLENNTREIKSSNEVLVPADKTTNYYKLQPNQYRDLLDRHIQKDYKKTTQQTVTDINKDAKLLAEDLNLDNKVYTLAPRPAYITIKDHKDNFQNNTQCRLINPTKSELGKISKYKLNSINEKIRSSTHLNQWKNTNEVIKWFNDAEDKCNSSFICFDIVNFYPSITQKTLEDAFRFAELYTTVDQKDRTLLMHVRQSLLFSENVPWKKRTGNSLFDVTMGSFDGAEVCELVGLHLLHKIQQEIKCNIGLYRDDGLGIINNTPRETENLKKKLCRIFKDCGLNITIEANKKIVDFLDVTFNLNTGSYKPFMKPGNTPLYVHASSNHPPSILKNIPLAINRRLCTISSDEHSFNSEVQPYQQALIASGYKHVLEYNKDSTTPNTTSEKQRARNIVWYNPPYNKATATNIGRKFLNIVYNTFTEEHILRKIFNRNTLKVSYACMPNIATTISSHNQKVLSGAEERQRLCNCRDKSRCPLSGNCQQQSIIYQATVVTDSRQETYIGLTEQTFKTRYNNHTSSFNNVKYKNATELSKYVWELKTKNVSYKLQWKILFRSPAYKPPSKTCHLCLTEKYCIICRPEWCTLNSRNELASSCRHRNKFLLTNYKTKHKD